MRRYKLDKPMVESKYPPKSKNVLWVDINESTGEPLSIKEFKNGNWETILSNVCSPENFLDTITYGVRWTKQGILESPKLERIGNLDMHKKLPIQNLFRGCVAKQDQIQYYLDANDWSKKEDGTPSVLDGTDGTVRVHTPKFYLKSWTYYDDATQLDVREVRISQVKVDNTWTEIPSCVIDAYCPSLNINDDVFKAESVNVRNSDKLTSFIGGAYNDWWDTENEEINFEKVFTNTDERLTDYGKSLTGVTRAQAREFAQNAGSELLSYFIYKALYWCMVIEYATFDLMLPINTTKTSEGFTQGGIGMGLRNGNTTITEDDEYGEENGSGIFNYSTYSDGYGRYGSRTPNGWADSLGNSTDSKVLFAEGETVGTGENPLIQDVSVFKWRGFENFCGDQYIWLDGFLSGTGYEEDKLFPAALYITEKSDALDDTFSNKEIIIPAVYTDGNGTISDYNLGDKADMIGNSEEAENYHLGMCDDQYLSVSYVLQYDDSEHKIYQPINEDGSDGKKVLRCGAYCFAASPDPGPGRFDAYYELSGAFDDVGFRTLNRIS